MNQLNLHISKEVSLTPPRNNCDIPILSKLSEAYQLWHTFFTHLPKTVRHTLGEKIDNLFTDCLELALLASYQSKLKKENTVRQLNTKFDMLKFFIKLLWEIKAIDTNKLTVLSTPLAEVGRMIGGWMKLYK
jgi:hypothetical protein